MKIKQLLLFFCLFSIISLVNAQSGYLGKRLIARYNFYGNVALSNPTYNSPVGLSIDNSTYYYSSGNGNIQENNTFHKPASDVPVIGMNKIHSLELEYLTSRKSSWAFLMGYTRTSFEHQKVIRFFESTYDNQYLFLYNPYDLSFKIHSYEYGIKYTKYIPNSGGIAPLGLYLSYQFSYFYNSIIYQREINDEIQKDKIHNFNSTAFIFEIGKQKVYYDRFLINLGVSLRYTFGSGANSDSEFLSDYSEIFSSNNYNANDDYYGSYDENDIITNSVDFEAQRAERNARKRMFWQQLFNVKIGVGYLIK